MQYVSYSCVWLQLTLLIYDLGKITLQGDHKDQGFERLKVAWSGSYVFIIEIYWNHGSYIRKVPNHLDMGDFINGGTPRAGWLNRTSRLRIDGQGYPHDAWETSSAVTSCLVPYMGREGSQEEQPWRGQKKRGEIDTQILILPSGKLT